MIQFSTNGLLQGITNKDTKEIVEKAITNAIKSSSLKQSPEESVKKDMYQNLNTLLKELSSQKKSPQQVLNTIKQPQFAKPMQQVAEQLNTLLNTLKSDKALSKFVPQLEKLLLDIKSVDSKKIQKGLTQTGVGFEAKLAKPTTVSTMPPELKGTLTELKRLLLQLDVPKKITLKEQIQTLIASNKVNKNFMSGLQEVLNQSKALLASQENLDSKNRLTPLVKEDVTSFVLKLETLAKASGAEVAKSDIKSILTLLQKNLEPSLQTQKHQTSALEKVENLLNASKADKGFINEVKTLILQINNALAQKGLQPQLLTTILKLQDLAQKSALLESKITNTNTSSLSNEVNTLKADVKQEMQILLNELKNPKSILSKLNVEHKETMAQLAQNILTMPKSSSLQQNTQTLGQGTLSEQISRIVNMLKSLMTSQSSLSQKGAITTLSQADAYLQGTKLTEKLEDVVKELINTKQLVPEQKLTRDVPIKEVLRSDIKGVLLSLRGELLEAKTVSAREILVQVDKALAQVEYHQLLSLSSGSFSSYLPMLWEGLKDGSITLKKLKDKRFFCEINLTLKEYGNVDLMMMLFEDVHVNISVFASQAFLDTVQSNVRLLKQGLNSLGLIPASINYFDEKKDKHKKEETRNFVHDAQIGSGFNLKV